MDNRQEREQAVAGRLMEVSSAVVFSMGTLAVALGAAGKPEMGLAYLAAEIVTILAAAMLGLMGKGLVKRAQGNTQSARGKVK